jgi:GNAT superfamily N-acetyltransferase
VKNAYSQPERLRKQHRLDDFDCGVEELNIWLNRHALQSNASGGANVFVTTTDGRTVVGYFALAAGSIRYGDATARVRKSQPQYPIPVVLLTRLAVDLRHQGRGIGQSLLRDAMLRADSATDAIGARALIVHAKDTQASDWYVSQGFDPSPTDPLHLQLLFKDLRRQLAE